MIILIFSSDEWYAESVPNTLAWVWMVDVEIKWETTHCIAHVEINGFKFPINN